MSKERLHTNNNLELILSLSRHIPQFALWHGVTLQGNEREEIIRQIGLLADPEVNPLDALSSLVCLLLPTQRDPVSISEIAETTKGTLMKSDLPGIYRQIEGLQMIPFDLNSIRETIRNEATLGIYQDFLGSQILAFKMRHIKRPLGDIIGVIESEDDCISRNQLTDRAAQLVAKGSLFTTHHPYVESTSVQNAETAKKIAKKLEMFMPLMSKQTGIY